MKNQRSIGVAAALISCGGTLSAAAGRHRRHTRRVRASLGHRRERPIASGTVRLSVVIPAFREPAIGDSVRRVRAELHDIDRHGGLEIIVVDDGSHDGTAGRAAEAGADQVISFPANRGKGAAVRAGILAASGQTIAFTDADLSYAPTQIVRLLNEAERGWDVVIGTRGAASSSINGAGSTLRTVGHHAINLSTRSVLRGSYADTQCGVKAFRSDAARSMFERARIDRFAFDIELLFLAERGGFSLREVPVELTASDRSTVNIVRDTLRLARDLGRIRWWALAGDYDQSSPAATAVDLRVVSSVDPVSTSASASVPAAADDDRLAPAS